MIPGNDPSDAILRDYFDALLQDTGSQPTPPNHPLPSEAAQAPETQVAAESLVATEMFEAPEAPVVVEIPQVPWWLCQMGRMRILVASSTVLSPLDANTLSDPPMVWHQTQIVHQGRTWQVLELARCINPNAPETPVTHLLPLRGQDVLLALPGAPLPFPLEDADIQWRTPRTIRPWLMGMTKDGEQIIVDLSLLLASCMDNNGPIVED